MNSTSTHTASSPSSSPARWLGHAAWLLAFLLALHGPIPQWPDYHHFADARSWGALPNAADVLSNLPFALVGLWALAAARRLRGTAANAWRLFALALVVTAVGSAAYHLAPDNATLVGDRLPIAIACAMLCCAFLAERVCEAWATPRSLAMAGLAAAASVAVWAGTESLGAGDLRAYLFVQFLPMVLVPAGLLLRLGEGRSGIVGSRAWWTVLAAYALAKGFELADAAVFEATGAFAGHALKHLFAAAGAAVLLREAVSSGSRR